MTVCIGGGSQICQRVFSIVWICVKNIVWIECLGNRVGISDHGAKIQISCQVALSGYGSIYPVNPCRSGVKEFESNVFARVRVKPPVAKVKLNIIIVILIKTRNIKHPCEFSNLEQLLEPQFIRKTGL